MTLADISARHVIDGGPHGTPRCAFCGQSWGADGCDAARLAALLTPERLAAATEAAWRAKGDVPDYTDILAALAAQGWRITSAPNRHGSDDALDYMPEDRTLVATDNLSDGEYGASAVVARDVRPWFGLWAEAVWRQTSPRADDPVSAQAAPDSARMALYRRIYERDPDAPEVAGYVERIEQAAVRAALDEVEQFLLHPTRSYTPHELAMAAVAIIREVRER